jgi:UDP-N-acetylglucosamine acyltransferase
MLVDPSAYVAPTAVVHPDASIGAGCHIGEFCVVESDVRIGKSCRLEPYVFVKRFTTMGNDNQISAGTVLGTDPLDKNFSGARSYLVMGSRNRVREHFTISRGTQPESSTLIGNDNYIMTSGHIAHNAVIGNDVVIASCTLVAGYVEVADRAFISGGVVIHQYSKIGRLAMIGGNTRVNLDVPPYFLAVGFHVEAVAPNVVGMKRAGKAATDVRAVKHAMNVLYRSGLAREDALKTLEEGTEACAITQEIAAFIRSSKRGICWARRRQSTSGENAATDV